MSETRTIIVYDLDSIKAYYNRLTMLKDQVKQGGQHLSGLSETLLNKASHMNRITNAQGENWRDPQYAKLKDAVIPCTEAIYANAQMMKETTRTIDETITQIEATLMYLAGQIAKLESIN